jgi:plasmid maintenance system antidote protein VapI
MTQTLREAIADSGLPMLTLAQRTGIVRQSLMRFTAGRSSLRLDVADKLAGYFGLELKPVTRRRKV